MSMVNFAISGLFLCLWLAALATLIRGLVQWRTRRKWIGIAGAILVAQGLVGFIGPAFSKFVPSSVEWPVGWAGDVITLPSGIHAVSHDPTNRIQLYDADWRFIRGWYVEAGGGVFQIAALPDDHLEAITARRSTRYVYDLQGVQLSSNPVPSGTYGTGRPDHVTLGSHVPTYLWLLALSHPFIAFFTGLAGLGLLALGGFIKMSQMDRKTSWPFAPTKPAATGTSSSRCPACDSPIGPNDINVAADTALCRQCGHSTTYSSLVHAPTVSIYTAPPDGCHLEDLGNRRRAVASCRSWMILPLIPMALFWNGILSVFIVAGISAFPWGLIVLVFISGHACVGAYLIWSVACMAFGDVEVIVTDQTISIGTGIGSARKRFIRDLRDVRSVRSDADRMRRRCLILDGVRPLKFGYLLNDTRRQFLHAFIASELRKHDTTAREPLVPSDVGNLA